MGGNRRGVVAVIVVVCLNDDRTACDFGCLSGSPSRAFLQSGFAGSGWLQMAPRASSWVLLLSLLCCIRKLSGFHGVPVFKMCCVLCGDLSNRLVLSVTESHPRH
uniref:Uncharacterized protein n=1 Tax=Eutreptiella gymnastica TaxID=73025 RepID=A0A7S1JIL0_9EUGL